VEAFVAHDLARIREIVTHHLRPYPNARAYIFGSRVDGTARPFSDVDLAILHDGDMSRYEFASLREALEESDILLEVDVVDLNETDADFRNRVLQGGKLWNDFASAWPSPGAR
jgi:predicted nucleotidyltransferase